MGRRSTGVRWFSPKVLAKTGALTAGFALFDSFFDKRELQGGLPSTLAVPPPTPGSTGFVPTLALEPARPSVPGAPSEIWISFGADTGDADDSTEAFAAALLGPLAVPARDYRPVDLVILGGDEVYPVASKDQYQQRFLEPWATGAERVGDPPTPVLALPGNHDWYDGLNAFLRVFTQGGHLGRSNATLPQGRSYWTVELPGNLWIWGADIEFGTDVDGPQRTYFQQAAAEMAARVAEVVDGKGTVTREREPGRVILCVSKPFWYYDDPERQHNVAFLEHVAEEGQGSVIAILTGDQHHYAHFEHLESGQHRITSGGGGAFCHPTHQIWDDGDRLAYDIGGDSRTLVPREAMVPTADESKRMGWGLVAFPWRNPSFLAVPAVVALLYLMIAFTTPQVRFELSSTTSVSRSFEAAMASFGSIDSILTVLVGSPAAIVLDAVLVGLLVAFAMPGGNRNRSRKTKWILGGFHAALWFLAMSGAIWLSALIAPDEGWAVGVVTVGGTLVLGALFGSIAMVVFLALSWGRCRWNGNEVFSAIRRNDLVHLLRIQVTGHEVVFHPIRLDPTGAGDGPQTDTSASSTASAIEEPFVLSGPSRGEERS